MKERTSCQPVKSESTLNASRNFTRDRIYSSRNKSNKTTRPLYLSHSSKVAIHFAVVIMMWVTFGGRKKKGDGPQSTRHNKRSGERRAGRQSEEICFAGMPGGLRASQLSKTVICASLSICAPAFCLLKISTFVFSRAASRCPRLASQEAKQTWKHLIDHDGLALATFFQKVWTRRIKTIH